MISIYLYVNAFLYFSFCVWCLIKFVSTSKFLGYSFVNNSGKVEYLTIYTGLQAGFAIFLALSGYYAHMQFAGLVFCVAIYVPIILTRTFSALHYKSLNKATYIVGSLEYVLAIWGIVLLINDCNNN